MEILLTGGTGFIGSALVDELNAAGHGVTVLTRQPITDSSRCRYVQRLGDLTADTRLDAVINLAGASMAGHRWSGKYKREILGSRIETTRQVLQLLQRMKSPPSVLLSASAIGFYGHHGDELLGENGAVVPGFAQELCQRWEAQAGEAAGLGVRVCLLRLGVVLDAGGGALQEMARSFNFGVASWMGKGTQWLSWVHRRDVIAAINFLLLREELSGPFNITAPNPVSSRGFCDAMKRHKRSLISVSVPAPVLRLLVGEMAEELLLNGQRVVPNALQEAGFEFNYPNLDQALESIF